MESKFGKSLLFPGGHSHMATRFTMDVSPAQRLAPEESLSALPPLPGDPGTSSTRKYGAKDRQLSS